MSTSGERDRSLLGEALRRPEFYYSLALFVTAVVALAFAIGRHGALPAGYGAGTLVFFLGFGLFTITVGYVHPRVGYVSFDRVAQVAGILVLGPVAAAWINGAASLLYPWHRLRQGRALLDVLIAALHNAGLMTLMILLCGLLYQVLGGPVPLLEMQWRDVATLLLLLASMQAINDAGMRVLNLLVERRLSMHFSVFAFIVESGAGLGGILVAVVFNRMETSAVALLLLVLSLGMLTLRELAHIRSRLEALVEERTHKLSEKSRELERMATHDPLTGLHNRRYADEYLEERIAEFERYGRDFALAIVDLDDFKRINDDFSHDAGDEVLRAIAGILAERCRETDLVARYGGEEFLLCFPEADMAAANEACEKIRVAVESTEWGLLVPGARVTLSVGVATMRSGLSRRALLGIADRALYAAKSAGRNRVRLALVHSQAPGEAQR
ncbi:MAG: GGDEF domain-containing protein [Gammaproteobacteria bacterium]